MISPYSRYAYTDVAAIDGVLTLVRTVSPPLTTSFEYQRYQPSESDRLYTVGREFFGDAGGWWRVADVNPEILDPFELLTVGRSIRVPRAAVS